MFRAFGRGFPYFGWGRYNLPRTWWWLKDTLLNKALFSLGITLLAGDIWPISYKYVQLLSFFFTDLEGWYQQKTTCFHHEEIPSSYPTSSYAWGNSEALRSTTIFEIAVLPSIWIECMINKNIYVYTAHKVNHVRYTVYNALLCIQYIRSVGKSCQTNT